MTKRLTNDQKLYKLQAKLVALEHEEHMQGWYGNDYSRRLLVAKIKRVNASITRVLKERYGKV